ncbi:hypothetical protein SAMN04488116_2503 [Flagellimonas flava]|uniref:Uncharacterized protein n=1 Tax=Flagellimonas flava TaxID=570519 RepID=A0A1M5ML17_9FLAO|nr:hypothetical protein SAMN04488116_2503 [Allomuricauda flava]
MFKFTNKYNVFEELSPKAPSFASSVLFIVPLALFFELECAYICVRFHNPL